MHIAIYSATELSTPNRICEEVGNFTTVMGVLNIGNILPRVRIKPAFWAIVLPLHHIDSPMSPLYPGLPVNAAPCLRGQCRLLHSSHWNCKSFNPYN